MMTFSKILTVLTTVVTAKDWQTLANCCSDHEGVCCAKAILIWLRKGELFEIKPQLANIACLFDGYLAGFCTVLSAWVVWIHEGGLVLACSSAAGKL